MELQQKTQKTSISRKLMLWLVSITMIVMLVFGLINYFLFVNQIEEDLDHDLEKNIQTLEEDLGLHMWNLDIKSIGKIFETHPFVRVLPLLRIRDNFGETIYEVDNRIEGEDYLFKEKTILYEGEDTGVIEIASPMESVVIAKQVIIRSTVVIILAVFFAVLFISFFVARSISKPIRNISDVSQEIAKGNLDKKVEVTTSDEVGQLGNAFNIMTSKLKESYAGLEKKVKMRTAELEKEKSVAVGREKKMAEMRTATLSILEDVDETREKLDKSNRLKDLFMDIMRHDLLNPAGVVRMNAQLALGDETDAEKKKVLESIERNSNRMIRMIENASVLAKLESGEKIEFKEEDLGVMLKGSVEELSERSKTKGMVMKIFAEGKFLAVVNPLIQNVFSNFLSNAIKYCPEKTEIIVGIKEKGDAWLVYVEDRGEGIPAKYKRAVFDRFTRLEKGAVKGSGLGLAISKKIVEAHKGKIWVGDHKGGGSVFYVLVPKRHVEIGGVKKISTKKKVALDSVVKRAVGVVKKTMDKKVGVKNLDKPVAAKVPVKVVEKVVAKPVVKKGIKPARETMK